MKNADQRNGISRNPVKHEVLPDGHSPQSGLQLVTRAISQWHELQILGLGDDSAKKALGSQIASLLANVVANTDKIAEPPRYIQCDMSLPTRAKKAFPQLGMDLLGRNGAARFKVSKTLVEIGSRPGEVGLLQRLLSNLVLQHESFNCFFE
jgi:hypothetical protein